LSNPPKSENLIFGVTRNFYNNSSAAASSFYSFVNFDKDVIFGLLAYLVSAVKASYSLLSGLSLLPKFEV
jgi:hypothetical protein